MANKPERFGDLLFTLKRHAIELKEKSIQTLRTFGFLSRYRARSASTGDVIIVE